MREFDIALRRPWSENFIFIKKLSKRLSQSGDIGIYALRPDFRIRTLKKGRVTERPASRQSLPFL